MAQEYNTDFVTHTCPPIAQPAIIEGPAHALTAGGMSGESSVPSKLRLLLGKSSLHS